MIYEIKRVRGSHGMTLRYRVTKTAGEVRREVISMPNDEVFVVKTSRRFVAILAVLNLLYEECLGPAEAAQMIEQIF